jgi:F-type H+-transporting ATPase subunit delta
MAGIAARRYVKAVYELSVEAGKQEQILEQLKQVDALVRDNDDLHQLLHNPSVDRTTKTRVFDEVTSDLNLSNVVSGLVRLLIRKSRIGLLEEIVEEYLAQENARLGVINLEVTTAQPLNEDVKRALQTKFAKSTGKTVEIESTVDPDIIGGMVARVGGTIYDGSIEHQLQMIQQRLGEK